MPLAKQCYYYINATGYKVSNICILALVWIPEKQPTELDWQIEVKIKNQLLERTLKPESAAEEKANETV